MRTQTRAGQRVGVDRTNLKCAPLGGESDFQDREVASAAMAMRIPMSRRINPPTVQAIHPCMIVASHFTIPTAKNVTPITVMVIPANARAAERSNFLM